MKKFILFISIISFCAEIGYSQIRRAKKLPVRTIEVSDAPSPEVKAEKLNYKFYELALAPKIELATEPMEGDDIVYHYLPGWTSGNNNTAQVSVLNSIKNKESNQITLEKVRYEYVIKGISKYKEISTGGVNINSNATKNYQNGREYHQVGDVLYFESGIPSSLTIKLYFKGFLAPVTVSHSLKPYAQAFGLPFKSSDLDDNEYWETGSTHGGGSQVFAYDLGVEAYVDGKWTKLKSGNGSNNSDFRVYGKKIYAMADGVIKGFNNEVPNNPKPGEKAAFQGYEHGGAGNHFYIQHGDVIALYAHMQKGSLNSTFMQEGKTVKKGDFLGVAGNSGNSSGPHLHLHIRKETDIETGPFRPLLFNDGYVIGKSYYSKPMGNIKWSDMNKQGVPGKGGSRSFIWPSSNHPYCAYPGNYSEISRHGVSSGSYQDVFNKIYTCGYYPAWVDGFEVNGKSYFNVSFRPDDGKPWVARHNLSGSAYQAEFTKWAKKGFRLVNVDAYVSAGDIKYAAIWRKDGGAPYLAYHGVSGNSHQNKFNDLVGKGWVPVNVSSVYKSGKLYVTALYEKKNVGGFYHHFGMSGSDYQANFNKYNEMGFKLVYINAYNVNNSPRFNAIWYKSTSFNSYAAKHGLSSQEYQSNFNNYTGNGFETLFATGYEENNSASYAALWVK